MFFYSSLMRDRAPLKMASLAIAKTICLALLVVALLSGCSKAPDATPPPQDTWYREQGLERHQFVKLPLYLYSPVREELIAEAVEAMGDGPLLQLSTGEARRYATNPLRTIRELRPFLIHGLYRQKRLFNIYYADRALWVDSADEPGDNTAVKRQPIVIYIDEVPPDVFVTLGWHLTHEQRTATNN